MIRRRGIHLIKLYMLTGFLGSGKTTLLQNLLKLSEGKKIGILINEFGKISIDGMLIGNEGWELLEINNGSIFCSCLKGSFIQGLIDFSNHNIDYLFVEGSGLSDPSNLGDILDVVHERTDTRYKYMGSLCVVDGLNFMKLVTVLPTLEKQVASSDQVIINKIDLLKAAELNLVSEKVKEINPSAKIIATSFCNIEPSIFEIEPDFNFVGRKMSYNTPDNRPKTLTLRTNGVFLKSHLVQFLKNLTTDLYRAKGFFLLEDGWNQVDMVGEQIIITKTELTCEQSTLVLISSTGLSVIRKISNVWKENFNEMMQLR